MGFQGRDPMPDTPWWWNAGVWIAVVTLVLVVIGFVVAGLVVHDFLHDAFSGSKGD